MTQKNIPAMEPMLIISPWPPLGRFWKIGRMACVMLMRPVTFVVKTTFMSSSSISGALATPLTSPLNNMELVKLLTV